MMLFLMNIDIKWSYHYFYQMAQNIIKHFPVMAENVLKQMKKFPVARPLKVADCNFGFGGHSKLILNNFKNALVYLSSNIAKLMI